MFLLIIVKANTNPIEKNKISCSELAEINDF